VIGRAVAVAREYNVTLAGLESLDGHDVYHLVLTPRFAPERNVLRELFVDRSTFEAVRIVIAVTAGVGPVRVHPVATIGYQHFAGGYVIATASAYVQMRFGFLSYGGDAAVRISDPAAVDAPPDWMFDAALLARHRASEGKSR
jgi:hypothetical protein